MPIASDIFDDEDEIIDEIIEVDPDESQYHPIVDGMDEDDPNEEEDEDESYDENEMDDLHNEFYEGNKSTYHNNNHAVDHKLILNQDAGRGGYDSRYFDRPDNDQAQARRPTSAKRQINGI